LDGMQPLLKVFLFLFFWQNTNLGLVWGRTFWFNGLILSRRVSEMLQIG
jgi:hypothetical protein